MNSNTTQPQPTMAPDATAVRTLANTVPPTHSEQEVALSPYKQFLYRQATRIFRRGGSVGDFYDYLQHAEEHHIDRAVGPPPVEATEMPSYGRGLAQQVLQGVTFGFGDEALGTLYGLITGEGGQAGRDQYRAELALWGGAHKKAALAAQIAGAAMLPFGAGISGLKALGMGSRMAAGMVGGGAAGIMAAGDTEGDLSNRAKAALMAAPFGVAFGIAFPAAAKYATQKVGSAVEKLAEATGTSGRLHGLLENLPGTAPFAARQALKEALARDGINVTEAANRVDQRAAHDLPTTVADVGGEHTLALANVAKQFQTPAQQALVGQLMARQANQGARLLSAIGTGSRLGLQNAYDLADQLMAQRSAQADPLYRQAFGQMVDMTAPLRKFLGNSVFQEAYATGRATAMAEDAAKLQRGLPVPELPADLKDIAQIPIRALDYMKRGLDFMIERAGKEGRPPLSRQTATALRTRLNTMLDQVGKKVPVYDQARGIWRGFSEQLDALEQGADGFFTKAPEVIAREIAGSSAPEMYRVGAIQAVANAVHGVGPDNANFAQRFFGARLFGTQDRTMAARIQNLFPDQAAASDFMDRLAGEAASTRALRRIGGNRQPNVAAGTEALNPSGRTQRVLEKVGINSPASRQNRARDVANEITMLFAKGLDDPAELAAMLHSLDRFQSAGQVLTGAARVAGGVAGAHVQ